MPNVLFAYNNLREDLKDAEYAIRCGVESERARRDAIKAEMADLYEHWMAYQRSLVQ